MSEAQSSDVLANLVKFVIFLAILGTLAALAIYFLVIIPGQQAAVLGAPDNLFLF